MSEREKTRSVFLWSLFWLLCIFSIQLGCILYINQGHFIYSLDDPYIHLSLSRAISHGWYGINSGEMSAPASSILWPFLLAPFANTAIHVYIPLLFNLVGMALSLYFFACIICRYIDAEKKLLILLTCLLALCCSLLGLVWLGMEHCLQLLLVIYIAHGMILICDDNKPNPTLYIAIILAPLIRYELLALAVAAVVFLYLANYRRPALLTFIIMFSILGIFTLFLLSNGLWWLPSSVLLKLVVLGQLLPDTNISLYNNPYSLAFAFCFFNLIFILIFQSMLPIKQRRLILIALILMIAQFIFGAVHMIRYSVYLYGFLLPTLIYSYKAFLSIGFSRNTSVRSKLFYILIVSFVFFPYIKGNIISPIQASHEIYLQQYQMQRLANIYRRPIAINDVGMISYYTKSYLLDFTGLSLSSKAMAIRTTRADDWMNSLCSSKNIHLVLIYEHWFGKYIPQNWHKLGELRLGIKPTVVGGAVVSFYAIPGADMSLIMSSIKQWSEQLPHPARYIPISSSR